MISEETIFVTQDGQKFNLRSEAEGHEVMLANKAMVGAFMRLEKPDTITRKMSEYTNLIVEWESWKARGVDVEEIEVSDVTPPETEPGEDNVARA